MAYPTLYPGRSFGMSMLVTPCSCAALPSPGRVSSLIFPAPAANRPLLLHAPKKHGKTRSNTGRKHRKTQFKNTVKPQQNTEKHRKTQFKKIFLLLSLLSRPRFPLFLRLFPAHHHLCTSASCGYETFGITPGSTSSSGLAFICFWGTTRKEKPISSRLYISSPRCAPFAAWPARRCSATAKLDFSLEAKRIMQAITRSSCIGRRRNGTWRWMVDLCGGCRNFWECSGAWFFARKIFSW